MDPELIIDEYVPWVNNNIDVLADLMFYICDNALRNPGDYDLYKRLFIKCFKNYEGLFDYTQQYLRKINKSTNRIN